MYETIFSPMNLGGLTLKNRIIFAPTTMGLPEKELQQKIKRIAAGGCAMIIIGDVPVTKYTFFSPSLYHKKGFAHYKRLCKIAHSNGCKICAQLHQSDSNIKGMLRYIPGVLRKKISMEELRMLLNEQVENLVTKMPAAKVSSITTSFGEAARLAKQAGFDMIQIHGDRMAGSFSSALFNKRTDRYGGNPKNRARFALEAISAVRHTLPEIPIDYKLCVRQENPSYGKAGVLLEELPIFIPLLERAGVTSFHVTIANHSLLTDTIPPINHPYFGQEGCFLKYCDQVRQYTNLPICGVGGLTDPDFIEQQLLKKRIDCAAMSRQLIADPAWPYKVKRGDITAIHHCVRCNQKCLRGIQQHKGIHCIYE